MLTLGQFWVIAGTACLALALEMVWFSALGFGSWINKNEPDRLEKYSVKRLGFSLIGYLIVATLIQVGLELVSSWWGFVLVVNGIVIIFILSQLSRRLIPGKSLIAEVGFISMLIMVMTYVMAHWPW